MFKHKKCMGPNPLIDTSNITVQGDYDGTGKGEVRNLNVSTDYQWENLHVASRMRLRDAIIEKASEEAIAYLKLDEHITTIECDARELTPSQWQARRSGNKATGRLGTVGASTSGAILGVSPYIGGTKLDAYHKIVGTPEEVPDAEDPARQHIFDVGHLAENYLQKLMESYYPGCEIWVDSRIYCHPDKSWMTSNLDFMLKNSDGGWIHGEFKTTNPFSAKEWDNGQIPPQYKSQIIQNQHVLNVDESRIVCAVLSPTIAKVPVEQLANPNFDFGKFVEKIIIRNYVRDLDEEYEQMKLMDDFWYNNVLPEIEPALAGSEAQIEAAIRKWRGYGKANTSISIESGLSSLCDELVKKQERIKELKTEIKRLEKDVESSSAPLKLMMGSNVLGLCADDDDPDIVYRVEYKPVKGRDSFKASALKGDDPELYESLIQRGYLTPAKAESSRSFSVKLISNS